MKKRTASSLKVGGSALRAPISRKAVSELVVQRILDLIKIGFD